MFLTILAYAILILVAEVFFFLIIEGSPRDALFLMSVVHIGVGACVSVVWALNYLGLGA